MTGKEEERCLGVPRMIFSIWFDDRLQLVRTRIANDGSQAESNDLVQVQKCRYSRRNLRYSALNVIQVLIILIQIYIRHKIHIIAYLSSKFLSSIFSSYLLLGYSS